MEICDIINFCKVLCIYYADSLSKHRLEFSVSKEESSFSINSENLFHYSRNVFLSAKKMSSYDNQLLVNIL